MKRILRTLLLFSGLLTMAAPAWGQEAPAGATARAIFAGGCFWCMEPPFEELPGVTAVFAGYTGGQQKNPTYEAVSAGGTGHLEAIEVHYDPRQITYRQLLDVFWRNIDPTDAGGQFVDRGEQYGAAIFYQNDEERRLAEESRQALAASGRFGKPIVTVIRPVTVFYPAEAYHQDYYRKHPLRYKFYRHHSGRDQFLDKIWSAAR